jgi:pyroglutamyl-peptidase
MLPDDEQGSVMTIGMVTGPVRVLVTGFGRYPGVRKNPTAELMRRVVTRLNRRHLGISAHGGELTVSYASARRELAALVTAHTPDAMLLLGLAARAHWVRIERYGRRLDSPLHPDATGQGGGRNAAGSDLPLAATALLEPALHAMLKRGVRARLSPSAGRYLCNAVYAAALSKAGGRRAAMTGA